MSKGPDMWDARIDATGARTFWLDHRDHTARELHRMFPERSWRTWQDRISKAKAWYPELWARKVGDGEVVDAPAFKGTHEIRSDGTHASERLIEITAEQDKDPEYLLEAHGFDPVAFELVSAKSNFWNQTDVVTLCQSKITVRPRVHGFCLEDMLASIEAAITPVRVAQPKRGKRLLELSYTDMHFGNSTLDNYQGTIARSRERIESQDWAEIVVWLGSDFFHTDNFKNTTSNGTPQSSMWWPAAVTDGTEFMGSVIECALAHARAVHVYYVPGNHDESMSWMFAHTLQHRYPQAHFDVEIAERKVHTFGHCAIGMTHGDEKVRKDLDRVFNAEFDDFRQAEFAEVHMGHLHHEAVVDRFGVVSRSLPTRARTDKWHRTEGFVGARKVFQVFEWDADCGLTDIHYV